MAPSKPWSTHQMDQTFVDEPTPRLTIYEAHENDLNTELFDLFFNSSPPSQSIGLSPAYSAGNLNKLAVSLSSSVMLIQFRGKKTEAARNSSGRKLLEERVLRRSYGNVVAFDLAPLALILYSDHGLQLERGVDIQSCVLPKDRRPLETILKAADNSIGVFDSNVISSFSSLELESNSRSLTFRAWVSQYITKLAGMEELFEKAPKVNTKILSHDQMEILGRLAQNGLRLDMKKPQQVVHSATAAWDNKQKKVQVSSQRYQDRMRHSDGGQSVMVKLESVNGPVMLQGTPGAVIGKQSSVSLVSGHLEGKILQISTIGQEGHTCAEAQRAATILRILQGSKELLDDNPWIQNIWFSSDSFVWPPTFKANKQPKHDGKIEQPLNDSQLTAVRTMLSTEDKHRIVLVQGPPGTGKTSVISCFVREAIRAGYQGLYLVAQSNVAVKNIAEKLAANDFFNFKLLVSQDFRFQWHEHLYERIKDNVIQSDRFRFLKPSHFNRCQVVLCTLSMLSSYAFRSCVITRCIPIKTVVVDEASQIEIGDYISVFVKYLTIRKVCFIGDDKQLPPHGQEEIEDLQSIFELQNMRKLSVFLDTQYRMPPQIGNFISSAVYDDKLKSNPGHPIKDTTKACHFIDVPGGKERPENKSYMNASEREVVLKLATHLQNLGCQYRIITPYEAQRSGIEEAMKAADLEWGDKVFNVDSFQGNEEDYIIISLVRSRELGFLKKLRRTNVMLTRCKRGMFICSSRTFLSGAGSSSLVGKLSKHMGEESWLNLERLKDLKL